MTTGDLPSEHDNFRASPSVLHPDVFAHEENAENVDFYRSDT